MNLRKGISVTITVLVTAMILFITVLLLGTLSRTTVDKAMNSISNLIGINRETAECNSIRTKCETMCRQACLTGSSTSGLVAEETEEDGTVYCSQHRCLTGGEGSWECTCGD